MMKGIILCLLLILILLTRNRLRRRGGTFQKVSSINIHNQGAGSPAPHKISLTLHPAYRILKRQNSNMLIASERKGLLIGIEDHSVESKIYRIEYESTLDGRGANAKILSNPWDRSRPNAGTNYATTHINSKGEICIGKNVTSNTLSSPYDLETVIQRSRFWCMAFSAFKETGDDSVFQV